MDTDVRTRRAESAKTQPVPNGGARSQPFTAQMRAETVEWEGKQRHKVEGYASITGRSYEMWDMFGPYWESIAKSAFDETLARNPDVAFLLNHRGMTMARTTNRTLDLAADSLGLRSVAYLNPERQDVRDLIAAIDDKDITEMSFAFMIEAGSWNEDYTEFRIDKVDIDRGDVSAVNYGANPYTSIAARSREVLHDLDHLPAGAQRAALERLSRAVAEAPDPQPDAGPGETCEPVEQPEAQTLSVSDLEAAVAEPEVPAESAPAESAGAQAQDRAPEPTGRSVRLVELMLDV